MSGLIHLGDDLAPFSGGLIAPSSSKVVSDVTGEAVTSLTGAQETEQQQQGSQLPQARAFRSFSSTSTGSQARLSISSTVPVSITTQNVNAAGADLGKTRTCSLGSATSLSSRSSFSGFCVTNSPPEDADEAAANEDAAAAAYRLSLLERQTLSPSSAAVSTALDDTLSMNASSRRPSQDLEGCDSPLSFPDLHLHAHMHPMTGVAARPMVGVPVVAQRTLIPAFARVAAPLSQQPVTHPHPVLDERAFKNATSSICDDGEDGDDELELSIRDSLSASQELSGSRSGRTSGASSPSPSEQLMAIEEVDSAHSSSSPLLLPPPPSVADMLSSHVGSRTPSPSSSSSSHMIGGRSSSSYDCKSSSSSPSSADASPSSHVHKQQHLARPRPNRALSSAIAAHCPSNSDTLSTSPNHLTLSVLTPSSSSSSSISPPSFSSRVPRSAAQSSLALPPHPPTRTRRTSSSSNCSSPAHSTSSSPVKDLHHQSSYTSSLLSSSSSRAYQQHRQLSCALVQQQPSLSRMSTSSPTFCDSAALNSYSVADSGRVIPSPPCWSRSQHPRSHSSSELSPPSLSSVSSASTFVSSSSISLQQQQSNSPTQHLHSSNHHDHRHNSRNVRPRSASDMARLLCSPSTPPLDDEDDDEDNQGDGEDLDRSAKCGFVNQSFIMAAAASGDNSECQTFRPISVSPGAARHQQQLMQMQSPSPDGSDDHTLMTDSPQAHQPSVLASASASASVSPLTVFGAVAALRSAPPPVILDIPQESPSSAVMSSASAAPCSASRQLLNSLISDAASMSSHSPAAAMMPSHICTPSYPSFSSSSSSSSSSFRFRSQLYDLTTSSMESMTNLGHRHDPHSSDGDLIDMDEASSPPKLTSAHQYQHPNQPQQPVTAARQLQMYTMPLPSSSQQQQHMMWRSNNVMSSPSPSPSPTDCSPSLPSTPASSLLVCAPVGSTVFTFPCLSSPSPSPSQSSDGQSASAPSSSASSPTAALSAMSMGATASSSSSASSASFDWSTASHMMSNTIAQITTPNRPQQHEHAQQQYSEHHTQYSNQLQPQQIQSQSMPSQQARQAFSFVQQPQSTDHSQQQQKPQFTSPSPSPPSLSTLIISTPVHGQPNNSTSPPVVSTPSRRLSSQSPLPRQRPLSPSSSAASMDVNSPTGSLIIPAASVFASAVAVASISSTASTGSLLSPSGPQQQQQQQQQCPHLASSAAFRRVSPVLGITSPLSHLRSPPPSQLEPVSEHHELSGSKLKMVLAASAPTTPMSSQFLQSFSTASSSSSTSMNFLSSVSTVAAPSVLDMPSVSSTASSNPVSHASSLVQTTAVSSSSSTRNSGFAHPVGFKRHHSALSITVPADASPALATLSNQSAARPASAGVTHVPTATLVANLPSPRLPLVSGCAPPSLTRTQSMPVSGFQVLLPSPRAALALSFAAPTLIPPPNLTPRATSSLSSSSTSSLAISNNRVIVEPTNLTKLTWQPRSRSVLPDSPSSSPLAASSLSSSSATIPQTSLTRSLTEFHASASSTSTSFADIPVLSSSASLPAPFSSSSSTSSSSSSSSVNLPGLAEPRTPPRGKHRGWCPTHKLQTVPTKVENVHAIAAETLAAVLEGRHDDKYDRLCIIDCRFGYEYRLGHIRGARHVTSPDYLRRLFFPDNYAASQQSSSSSSSSFDVQNCAITTEETYPSASTSSSLCSSVASSLSSSYSSTTSSLLGASSRPASPAVSMFDAHLESATPNELTSSLPLRDNDDRTLIVFHCEFSQVRGPVQFRYLRSCDRNRHGFHGFPNMFYPEVYLLEGGYKNFQDKFPQHCEPRAYQPMEAPPYFDISSSLMVRFCGLWNCSELLSSSSSSSNAAALSSSSNSLLSSTSHSRYMSRTPSVSMFGSRLNSSSSSSSSTAGRSLVMGERSLGGASLLRSQSCLSLGALASGNPSTGYSAVSTAAALSVASNVLRNNTVYAAFALATPLAMDSSSSASSSSSSLSSNNVAATTLTPTAAQLSLSQAMHATSSLLSSPSSLQPSSMQMASPALASLSASPPSISFSSSTGASAAAVAVGPLSPVFSSPLCARRTFHSGNENALDDDLDDAPSTPLVDHVRGQLHFTSPLQPPLPQSHLPVIPHLYQQHRIHQYDVSHSQQLDQQQQHQQRLSPQFQSVVSPHRMSVSFAPFSSGSSHLHQLHQYQQHNSFSTSMLLASSSSSSDWVDQVPTPSALSNSFAVQANLPRPDGHQL